MSRSTNTRSWLVHSVAAVLLLAGARAYGETKWYDAIAINGHIQTSYVGNLSKSQPQVNELRGYDQEVNSFNLNQVQLKIAKPVAEDNYGFAIKLLMGRDARIIKSAGMGDVDFDVEEAFVTLACPMVKGMTYTAGKFVTNFGVEVIESPANNQISPGYLFFFGIPFTHTGLKANYAFNDRLNMTAGVVNGWDTTADANAGKTLIWQLATVPMANSYANVQGSYGPEALADPGGNHSKRTALDFTLGTTIGMISVAGEALWGQDTNVTALSAPVTAGPDTETWKGVGLWVAAALHKYINPSVRFEVFDDGNNANRLLSAANAPANQTAKNFTLTNKFKMTDNAFVRLEFRHDFSNNTAYTRDDGSAVRVQNTVGADWVVTF